MIKMIIGFLGMFGLIFQASGIAMWGDAASLAIVVGVIVFGLLPSGKDIPSTISTILKKSRYSKTYGGAIYPQRS